MGKTELIQKQKKWLKEFDGQFRSDGQGVIMCVVCDHNVPAEKKSQLTQHVVTAKHRLGLEKNKKEKREGISSTQGRQQMLTEMNPSASSYSHLVAKAFIHSNVSLNVLNNQHMKLLLKTNSNGFVPAELTIHKNYLPRVYDEVIDKISKELDRKKIWSSIDETTDAMKRFVACFVVGQLSAEKGNKSYLLNCEVLEEVNYETISNFFQDSIDLLWHEKKSRKCSSLHFR